MSTTQNGPTPVADAVGSDPSPTKPFVANVVTKEKMRTLTRGSLFFRAFIVILVGSVLLLAFGFASGVTSNTEGRFAFDFDRFMTTLGTLLGGSWVLIVALVVLFIIYRAIRFAGKKMGDGIKVSPTVMLLSILVIVLLTLLLRENFPQIPQIWTSNLAYGLGLVAFAALSAWLISLSVPRLPKGNTNH